MTYRVQDLTRILCGSLDMYTLDILCGGRPQEVDGSTLRWAKAVEFLKAYIGETGSIALALRLRQAHPSPDMLSVVNRHVLQVDGKLYSMDTGGEVSKDREDLKVVVESHAISLAAAEGIISRDLRRAQRA